MRGNVFNTTIVKHVDGCSRSFSQYAYRHATFNCWRAICKPRGVSLPHQRIFKHINFIAAVLMVLLTVSNSVAYASQAEKQLEPVKYFEIDPGSLRDILNDFVIETDCEIFYSADIVENVHSPGVRGMYLNHEALSKILEGTGLKYERTAQKVFLIHIAFGLTDSSGEQTGSGTAVRDDTPPEGWQIEELVITANKRSQAVQDVAMSVSTVEHSQLQARALVSMEDYLSAIPGVNQIDRGVGRNSIVMRGVAADPVFEDSTVGVYFDEVPLTGRAYFGSADLKLVDMERIEVLKGPQGTLYGAGSLAGTLRNIPVEPNLNALSGSITAGYSDMAGAGSGSTKLTGILNMPIVDNELAIRATGYRFDNSGYIKNTAADSPDTLARAQRYGVEELAVNDNDVGRSEYRGGRLRLLWEPNDEFSVTGNYVTQDLQQHGFPEMRLDLDGYTQARLQLIAPIGGGEQLLDDFKLTNVTVRYDWEWAYLLSSTSFFKEQAQRNTVLSPFQVIPFAQASKRDARVFIEELRLVSSLDGSLQWLAGLYYEDNRRTDKVVSYLALEPVNNTPTPSILALGYWGQTRIKQTAMFGDISYELSDQIQFTFGGRFYHFERGDVTRSQGALLAGGQEIRSDYGGSEPGINVSANVQFTPSDNELYYLQYSEGFRLGVPQTLVPVSRCDVDNDGVLDGTNVPIDTSRSESDNLESTELGLKLTGLDRRLTFNAAVYYNNWSGIAVTVNGLCGFFITVNAGDAVTQGFDGELSINITPKLKVHFGASVVDARLTKNSQILSASRGTRLAGSPRYSANTALQYDFDILAKKGFIRVDYSYVGGFYASLTQRTNRLGNYHLFNIKSGIRFEQLSFEFYLNNASNSERLIWANDSLAYPLKPRTVGMNIKYQF